MSTKRKALYWPRRNPYDKRWYQRTMAEYYTRRRRDRVAEIIARWEPRLWEVRVNMPERLLNEARYLARVDVDWRPFPMWVTDGK